MCIRTNVFFSSQDFWPECKSDSCQVPALVSCMQQVVHGNRKCPCFSLILDHSCTRGGMTFGHCVHGVILLCSSQQFASFYSLPHEQCISATHLATDNQQLRKTLQH